MMAPTSYTCSHRPVRCIGRHQTVDQILVQRFAKSSLHRKWREKYAIKLILHPVFRPVLCNMSHISAATALSASASADTSAAETVLWGASACSVLHLTNDDFYTPHFHVLAKELFSRWTLGEKCFFCK